MTFKWTYAAAVLLFVAVLLAGLPVRGGDWGVVSHLHGAILIAIGGGLVLLTRRVKPKPPIDGDDVTFVSYPEHQVLSIVEGRDEAAGALRGLRDQGRVGRLTVYSGDVGVAALDSEGLVHGVVGVTERSVEHLIADLDDLAAYDEAARAGHVIIAFDGADEEARRRGAAILERHGAHTIQYFGSLAVEVLDIDHSRTRV